ncbi:MAG: hypothetical protein LBI58_05720 [Tannerellaceae bacterium]|jgi:hypothetical protein|nr:hypothetical protein [Tannerellaceae bacterium]
MTLSPKYQPLLLLAAVLLLGGCYKEASDSFIDEEIIVDPGDREEDAVTVEQNRWTYEEMKSDYLWEETLPDTSLLNMEEYPKKFFDRLKYGGDRFSWIEINPGYSDYSLYDRYGIDYAAYLTDSGEVVYRLLLARNDVMEGAGLRRGDWFRIEEDAGSRLVVAPGSIDNGSFRPAGHIFLEAQDGALGGAVLIDSVYRIGGRRIAYIFYNEFIDGDGVINNPYRSELRAVFARFRAAGVTDIVVDLRYNPGGHVSICQYFASMMLKDEHLGGISGYHSYNKNLAAKQYEQTGNEESLLYFAGAGLVGDVNLGLDRAWFIISGRTASASESLINSLSPFMETVTAGSQSVGKGVGSWTIEDRRYEWKLQPITFRYYNSLHETVPDSGLTPDIAASDEHDGELYELGDVRERLLGEVLEHITGGRLRSAAPSLIGAAPLQGFTPARRRTEGYIDKFTL